MKITSEMILKVMSYCSLIHHINGRLRVRINPSIKKELENFSKDEIANFSESFKSSIENFAGIKNIRLNKTVASLTIEYDKDIIPKSFWDNVLNGKDLDIAANKFNQLLKDAAWKKS